MSREQVLSEPTLSAAVAVALPLISTDVKSRLEIRPCAGRDFKLVWNFRVPAEGSTAEIRFLEALADGPWAKTEVHDLDGRLTRIEAVHMADRFKVVVVMIIHRKEEA